LVDIWFDEFVVSIILISAYTNEEEEEKQSGTDGGFIFLSDGAVGTPLRVCAFTRTMHHPLGDIVENKVAKDR